MPSILDSCPKAGATVVRSSWPRRVVVGFASGRIVAWLWCLSLRCRVAGGCSLWRYLSGALFTGCGACRAWSVVCGCAWSASGSPRMREHRRSAARSGSAAIVLGAECAAAAPTPCARRRIAPHRGPGKRAGNLRAWLFGFWPHFD